MRGTIAMVILAAMMGAIASQALASTLLGPKGHFSTLIYTLKWEPGNACFKPTKPYSKDQYAWNLYKNEGIRYLDCIKNAANSDADYAVDAINEGYKDAADNFIREATSRY